MSVRDDLERAIRTYEQEGPVAALPLFERIRSRSYATGDHVNEATALGWIGNCQKRLGRFDEADAYLKRSLGLARSAGDRHVEARTLNHLGLLEWEKGDYGAAIAHLKRSNELGRAAGDAKLQGSALNNLSLVYDELGDYRRSLEGYERALELYRQVDFPRGESDTLGNIGGIHLLLGRYREAMTYYRRSLEISERLGLKASIAQDHGNLALCHLGLAQNDQALSEFARALAVARDAGLEQEEAYWLRGEARALVATGRYELALAPEREALETYMSAGAKADVVESLHEMGRLELLLGDIGSAEQRFQRALTMAREIRLDRGITTSLLALGEVDQRRGRFQQARARYIEALQRALNVGDHGRSAESLIELARVCREEGRLAESEENARAALATARTTGASLLEARALFVLAEAARAATRFDEAVRRYADAEALSAPADDVDLLWQIRYGRGLAHAAAGRRDEAIKAIERAVEVIESVRGRLAQERYRSGYLADKQEVYTTLVRLRLEDGDASGAFAAAERSRARSFREMLDRGHPAERGTVREGEAEIVARIRHLREQIAEETAVADSSRITAVEILSTELAAAERAYQNGIDDVLRRDPGLAIARGVRIPTSPEIQRRIPAGVALIAYLTDDERTIAFVLTSNAIHALQQPLGSGVLRAKTELLNELVQRRATDEWRLPARSLGKNLIVPLEEAGWLRGIERLYIVPDGVLHYVPFAALPMSDGRTLLGDVFVVAYLPAASLLVNDRFPATGEKGLLAMAPERARLRFAADEAHAVARLAPGASRVIAGSKATERKLKQLAPQYRIVHLATHGRFNRLNPLLSALELERGDGEDGDLHVYEILRLGMRADLVTLSACGTDLGSGYFQDIPAGDEFVSLTRAFLVGGAQQVVASLWSVDDRSTAQMMEQVYRRLDHGDAAAALAAAQREQRPRAGASAHPYAWAAFKVVGVSGKVSSASVKNRRSTDSRHAARILETASDCPDAGGVYGLSRKNLQP